MMTKRIILIHGRNIKPAHSPMKSLARKAILEGISRSADPSAGEKISNGDVKLDFVYYGDINNRVQATEDKGDRELFEAHGVQDPDHNNQLALPISWLASAYDQTLEKTPKFTKTAYANLLREVDDWRFLDEAADFASFVGSLFTFGVLNQFLLKEATPDMAAYLTDHNIGSTVRGRLREKLQPALEAGDDICLIAHSMGSIVSYDLLWKFSHESEYSDLKDSGAKVNRFVTIGCPLGELGVQRNLLDGRYFSHSSGKYPRHNIGEWLNFHAEDDYVARAEKMSRAFSKMKSKGYLDSIKDKKIYNCWNYTKQPSNRVTSNPHDLYGYLMNQFVGNAISDWIAT